jgi:hypothetical protein
MRGLYHWKQGDYWILPERPHSEHIRHDRSTPIPRQLQ